MLEAIITAIIILLMNIVAWVFTYGKLSQKVDNLDRLLNNGLCDKVEGISRSLAELKGSFETFKEMSNE